MTLLTCTAATPADETPTQVQTPSIALCAPRTPADGKQLEIGAAAQGGSNAAAADDELNRVSPPEDAMQLPAMTVKKRRRKAEANKWTKRKTRTNANKGACLELVAANANKDVL